MRPYTLKQIQTFLEVARQRSVSKAAERLFVTQPAVSMQIRQLEEAFGLALIEPLGRTIRLTVAGEALQAMKSRSAPRQLGLRLRAALQQACALSTRAARQMLQFRFGRSMPTWMRHSRVWQPLRSL